MLLLRTHVGLAGARLRSWGKSVDSLAGEAHAAVELVHPAERFAKLSRLIVEVKYQEKGEPRRALVLRAALLDLAVESLQAFARREPSSPRV